MIARGALGVLLAAAVVAPVAHAQPNQAAATVEFDRGRTLMKQKKYADACAAFEKSQKLDAQNGTLFNLADCNVHLGKLATAWIAYKDLAARDTNAQRKSESEHRSAELEPRLPKLLVKVPDDARKLSLTINGNDSTALAGTATPVDLGDFDIHVTAAGREPFDTSITIKDEGKTVTVTVDLPKKDGAGSDDVGSGSDAGSDGHDTGPSVATHSTRKRNGVIAIAVGGGALAVGAVFGVLANSNYGDAKTLCPNLTCTSAADKTKGDGLVSSARTDATLSTGFVIVGALAAVAGAYLIVTARPESSTSSTAIVAPLPSGAMVGWAGHF